MWAGATDLPDAALQESRKIGGEKLRSEVRLGLWRGGVSVGCVVGWWMCGFTAQKSPRGLRVLTCSVHCAETDGGQRAATAEGKGLGSSVNVMK